MYDERTLEQIVADSVNSARGAFGHVEGRSDIECLALALSNTDKIARRRLADNEFLHDEIGRYEKIERDAIIEKEAK